MQSDPQSSTRRFFLAWFLALVFIAIAINAFLNSGADANFDFRAFYTAGRLVVSHPSQLYNLALQEQTQHLLISPSGFLPYYHPAYQALLFAPFCTHSYRAAYAAFAVFNFLLLIVIYFAARPAFERISCKWNSGPDLLLLLFFPVLATLMHGQDSILLLLLCALAWRQLESEKDVSAGCLLALALFKFQAAIPLAILIAIRRGRRFAAGFCATGAALVALSIGITGIAGAIDYIHLLSGAVSAVNKTAGVPHGMEIPPSAMTNLAGLLYGCGGRLLPSHFFSLLVDICSLSLFAWCAWAIRRRGKEEAFSIALLCAILVSFHLFLYDLSLALLPGALLARRMPGYILTALFLLPPLLLPLGSHWFFPAAIPVLIMLLHTLLSENAPMNPTINP